MTTVKMFYVYLLRGSKYYLGVTNDIERRYREHIEGKVYSTRRLGNELRLVGYLECETRELALSIESKLKKSGHVNRITGYSGFVGKI